MADGSDGGNGEDWSELWGRRIGRGLAVAVAVALIIWLIGPYLWASMTSG
jgi:hypothetical protein